MIATDSETVEIVAPVDVLRRLDIEVTIASIHGKAPVRTTCGIIITPDVDLADCDKDAYDAIIMPGGWEGYKNLVASQLVGEFLRNQYDQGKLVASICMAGNAFLAHKVGLGNKLTSYPKDNDALKAAYEYLEVDVVQDKVRFQLIEVWFFFHPNNLSEHDYIPRTRNRIRMVLQNR